MSNKFHHTGHPPAHTLVRVWYSLNAGGRAPLVSKWIAIPHASAPNAHAPDVQSHDVCAVHLCSLELRSDATCDEFDDPGPVFTLQLAVTRA
jgi:hypothetical protein